MSQTDLARCVTRSGVSIDQAAVSRIESRERIVSDCELHAIARCLGISVGSLFENEKG